jgi:N-acyl-D-aspartate/D-glutamate deacylase
VSLLVKGARVVTAADDYTADVFVAEDTVTMIAAGRAIVDNGAFTGKPGSGRYIARDASGQQQRDEGAR